MRTGEEGETEIVWGAKVEGRAENEEGRRKDLCFRKRCTGKRINVKRKEDQKACQRT